MPNQEQLLQELNQNLTKLNQLLKKQNSLGHGILLGFLRGLGNFLGTLVIAGVLFYLGSRLLQTLDVQGYIQDLMQTTVNQTMNNLSLPVSPEGLR